MNYYTYAYLREDGTPYYIGKGKGKRIYKTRRRVKLPKDKSRIIFLKQNLTEEEAFKHEKYMIAVFGRKDNGTGILRNLTDGGDGVPNWGTPEQRSEIARKHWANKTPEQRSEIVRKANASRTPEQRTESGRKANSKLTPEQRSQRSKKSQASRTPEQRSEVSRKANASRTPEQRSEVMRKANASRTPEQRKEIAKKANASMTLEQKSVRGKKASSQMFQCTETGYIGNAGVLALYQRRNGIDTSKRIRLS